ncbi:unnamed protein product, partial [Nippostrongylus brasiliensis]|uniref:PiggyBac transposable element-derived protein 4 (inferred by orthology to a human protein) n=1 Tax=Nippostrongylus brasiliensis TaxID=27835 RepID=A0A0N4YQB3_NIPBR
MTKTTGCSNMIRMVSFEKMTLYIILHVTYSAHVMDSKFEDEDALLQTMSEYDDSESEEPGTEDDEDEGWKDDFMALNRWDLAVDSRLHDDVFDCDKPLDYFRLFVNDHMVELIVTETNRYGAKKMDDWVDTNVAEVMKFVGLCIQMGMVRMPSLRDYWSTRPGLGGHSIAGKIMPRTRFENLLKCLHFADNDQADTSSRLYKILPILNGFNKSFGEMYKPGRELCVDESLIPFRGRIIFRQYIPSKRHKYGIKLFKLCSHGGYTSKVNVYAGKDKARCGTVADSVIMELMEDYLDQGRHLCTDNWYTSIPLARTLIKRKTNLVGTLRRNRKGIPSQVKEKKLKRGESCSQQDRNGIMVMKWKDKREIFMLSTSHDNSFNDKGKPTVVEKYNQMKAFVDLSDQMAAYTPFVRKTTK